MSEQKHKSKSDLIVNIFGLIITCNIIILGILLIYASTKTHILTLGLAMIFFGVVGFLLILKMKFWSSPVC